MLRSRGIIPGIINLLPLYKSTEDNWRVLAVVISSYVVSRHSDHVPCTFFARRMAPWSIAASASYHGTVVTSLVCGTLSPFAIFIHPRIVITCARAAECQHVTRRSDKTTDCRLDDDFFETQSHDPRRRSPAKTCPTSRLSRCSSNPGVL